MMLEMMSDDRPENVGVGGGGLGRKRTKQDVYFDFIRQIVDSTSKQFAADILVRMKRQSPGGTNY